MFGDSFHFNWIKALVPRLQQSACAWLSVFFLVYNCELVTSIGRFKFLSFSCLSEGIHQNRQTEREKKTTENCQELLYRYKPGSKTKIRSLLYGSYAYRLAIAQFNFDLQVCIT